MSNNAYQVIARRWRPKQFSELVGQDHVVQTLGNAIEMDRIAHAYLFVGPRGTGKTTSARLFAKSLNWEDGPSLDVPDSSEIGNAIMDGRCLDVIEIDGASNNSVDQVRDLRDECQYAPAQCRYKIYVIDEVHMLSQQAFNALLKTLEEPPPHVKFVFATTESHKVLPTIVSRCQRFEFRSIPVPLIVSKLEEICTAEGIEVEKEAIVVVARMAMGGMRDAQSILDQMISFCGTNISQKDVLDVYGLASSDRIGELAKLIIDANYDGIIEFSDSFSTEGIDFYRALLDLSDSFRELLLSILRNNEKSLNHSPEQVVRILDALREGENLVRMGLSEKTNFEVTLFRAVEAGRTRSIDHVIRKITNLIPEDIKKKTVLENNQSRFSETKLTVDSEKTSKINQVFSKEELVNEKKYDTSVDNSISVEEDLKPKVKSDSLNTSPNTNNVDGKKIDVNTRQVVDREKIESKIAELPKDLRKILEEKFQAEFVSIEKIDMDKLI